MACPCLGKVLVRKAVSAWAAVPDSELHQAVGGASEDNVADETVEDSIADWEAAGLVHLVVDRKTFWCVIVSAVKPKGEQLCHPKGLMGRGFCTVVGLLA